MVEFFRGQSLVKMRLVMLGTLVIVAFLIYLGIGTLMEHTVSLAPPGEAMGVRVAAAIGSWVFAGLILWGMKVYGTIYIIDARWDETSKLIRARTLTYFGTEDISFAPDDVQGSRYSDGGAGTVNTVTAMSGSGSVVDAPWFWLRVRTLPRWLIIDCQGKFIEPDLVGRLFGIRLRRPR